jgi:LDH2 family malate/lactate/ureidoglycolate dehydrogenase
MYNYDIPVRRYNRNDLNEFCEKYLMSLGANEEEARITSAGVVAAASRWHPGKGQGLEKLFRLTLQLGNGGINCNAEFEVLEDSPAAALVDGHQGFGYVVAQKGSELAVEKASKVGIGIVSIKHSNHFGQAGYHAESITKSGMIGYVMTNARAEMAPWGATEPVLATSPWGIGIPIEGADPILLDMALTQSGQGMVMWAFREGQDVPDNWMLTADGAKSTNPADFLNADGSESTGTQYPIGEFKGYGLALFTDVLCGVMSGSLFGTQCFQGDVNHDVGHMIMAFNPEFFMEKKTFQERLAQLVGEIRSAKPIEGRTVYLPGELEFLTERDSNQSGVPIDERSVEKLLVLADNQNVSFPSEI